MKIYTKTGDQGDTGLSVGPRVMKDHVAIELCGGLDETNSAIGLACSCGLPETINTTLQNVQNELFSLGCSIANCASETTDSANRIVAQNIKTLEDAIDRLDEELPALSAFILPGGDRGAATLHFARTICRRAERVMVRLIQDDYSKMDLTTELIYLNRLSDYLFVAARWTNHKHGVVETKWLSK